jgi:hypothetical protein
MSGFSLGPCRRRGQVRERCRPHLVTVKVSQVVSIQSYPSLLIDIRSGEAGGQQSKGLGVRGEVPGVPQHTPFPETTHKVARFRGGKIPESLLEENGFYLQ